MSNNATANTAVANNGFLNKMGNVVSNHGKLSFVIIIVLLVVIIILLYRSGSLPYFSKKDESDSSSSEKADESKTKKIEKLEKIIETINNDKK